MHIKSPVLKYYGSKFRLAKWIIPHFPEHRHYVEPFGGAANVLLQKPPSALETYNDLNDDLVTFFRVLRDKPKPLIRSIRHTPWSRTEFEICRGPVRRISDIERARRIFFSLWMSIEGGVQKGSFRRHNRGTRPVTDDIRPADLLRASRRLRSVMIEKRDALDLMRELDSPDTLFYLDPPYMKETRVFGKMYSHEMDDRDHLQFLELVRSLKGMSIVSGYPSKLYADELEAHGWLRVDKRAMVNNGGHRTECIWISVC